MIEVHAVMARLFAPKDKTKREHLGRVERIVYSSPTDDYVILALQDGASVKGPASAERFDGQPGTIFRFCGRWVDSEERGPQFHFDTWTIHTPAGRAGVVKYLTEVCDGIGVKTANKLFDKYGGECVRLLIESPEEIASTLGLDREMIDQAANDLHRESRFQETKLALFDLFHGRGFSGKLINKVIDLWGANAPAKIRRNPFCLLGKPSAGFKRCDRLWSDLKLPPDRLKRQGLCAWNILRNETQGHTWVPAEELASKLKNAIPTANPVKAFRFAIRARKLKKYKDAAGKVWLAVYNRATSEERIVAAVARLMSAPPLWPTARVPVSEVDGDRLPTAHQVERLKLATRSPIGMLLGGPGTGKTHTLAYLLRAIVDEFGISSIGACAPTGKAANRMTQAIQIAGLDLRSKTIHSTLEIGRNGHDGDGWDFVHNAGNPLPYKFLFADESSMDDSDLLACLLDACAVGTHVLLIGDPDQLPPVGHGAPLRDLIDAGVPCGTLTQVQRNAGQIVHACARIRNGESFETCDRIDLDAKPPQNLKLIQTRDVKESAETLVDLLKKLNKFDPVWQTQVMVARNKRGDLCRTKLNELLHPILNSDGYSVAGNTFKVNDKIICLRNSWMHRVEQIGRFHKEYADQMAREAANYQVVYQADDEGDTGRDPEEVFVANGEIGRVVAVGKGLTIARFSEGEALVKIPMGKQQREDDGPEGDADGEQGRGCNFDHAYAVTVHKMQGSESPCVIIMADPEAGMICDRSWWYTAISRASKLCILIGQQGWIDKQRLRQAMVRRKTHLREQLVETLFKDL